MSFYNHVIGHREVISRLQALIAHQKIPHGLLFWGEDGIGKMKVATSFAMELLAYGDAAEEGQRTINRVLSGNHPDFFVLDCEEGKSEISTAQIEEVNQLCLTFAEKKNGYRVFVIRNADLMNEQASNRFLKTLEEPPMNTIFILITSNRHGILPTILSRCQHIFFKPLEFLEVSAVLGRALKDKEELIPADFLESANYLSGGKPGYVIQVLEDRFELVFKAYNRFFNRPLPISYESLLLDLEQYLNQYQCEGTKLHQQRQGFICFLEYSILYFREFLIPEVERQQYCKLWDFRNEFSLCVDSKFVAFLIDLAYKYLRYTKANCNIGMLQYAFCMSLSKAWNSEFSVKING